MFDFVSNFKYEKRARCECTNFCINYVNNSPQGQQAFGTCRGESSCLTYLNGVLETECEKQCKIQGLC